MTIAAIKREYASLKRKGADFGAAIDDEQSEFGGRYQQYERGRIYWHNSTGAHGLWGRILERYLQGGGAGVGSTGTRELGFPKTSNTPTADGMYGCASFQRGYIVDFPETPLVRIFGTVYSAWKRLNGELGILGHPIGDPMSVAGGHLAWFERGMLWHPDGQSEILVGELVSPTLGQPAIVDQANPGSFRWLRFSGKTSHLTSRRNLVDELFRGRFKLVAVGAPSTVPLEPAGLVRKGNERWLQLAIPAPRTGGRRFAMLRGNTAPLNAAVSRNPDIAGPGGRPPATALERRRLYNLAIAVSGTAPVTVSPHCVYARGDWETFGIAHITDLHISRRVDYFRAALRRAEVAESDIAEFNNINDRFREFIRYANHLHDAGLLDVIIATGDLVDYVREHHHAAAGPGNFAIFENLVRGRDVSPDSESPRSEELRVPIFTSLGNHDYRRLAYPLAFVPYVRSTDFVSDLIDDIPLVGDFLADAIHAVDGALLALPGVGIALEAAELWIRVLAAEAAGTVWNHKPFNLLRAEALKVIGKKSDGEYTAPAIRPRAAAAAVMVDVGMARGTHPYFRRINRDRSYVVSLGGHRIVMLDTRWDDGIGTGVIEAVVARKFGALASEGTRHFFAGSPDSVGISRSELDLVRGALRGAVPRGVVIVGMHAPPLCPPGGEQPICLRETVHPTNDAGQVEGYLRRRKEFKAGSHRNWPFSGTPYFHVGSLEKGLDDGTAVGVKDELAQLFAGRAMPRPVSLVVSGHGHYRHEFRLKWDAQRARLETYNDHYLSTPGEFYPTHVIEGDPEDEESNRRYLTRVEAGAPPQGTKHHLTDPDPNSIWPDLSYISIPPYAEPLSESRDEADWWVRHSPVVTQTAALGPCDNSRVSLGENEHKPGPNHQGFRMISIADNVIRRVHYVRMDELRRGFPLPWETGRTSPTPPLEPPVREPVIPNRPRRDPRRDARVGIGRDT
jgi:predicted MPP superfamily phosphohydrolase